VIVTGCFAPVSFEVTRADIATMSPGLTVVELLGGASVAGVAPFGTALTSAVTEYGGTTECPGGETWIGGRSTGPTVATRFTAVARVDVKLAVTLCPVDFTVCAGQKVATGGSSHTYRGSTSVSGLPVVLATETTDLRPEAFTAILSFRLAAVGIAIVTVTRLVLAPGTRAMTLSLSPGLALTDDRGIVSVVVTAVATRNGAGFGAAAIVVVGVAALVSELVVAVLCAWLPPQAATPVASTMAIAHRRLPNDHRSPHVTPGDVSGRPGSRRALQIHPQHRSLASCWLDARRDAAP
jgi:hypothetical protein